MRYVFRALAKFYNKTHIMYVHMLRRMYERKYKERVCGHMYVYPYLYTLCR